VRRVPLGSRFNTAREGFFAISIRSTRPSHPLTVFPFKRLTCISKILDVDLDDEVQITTSQDPDSITTLYAVSIPVKGVKPEFDVENETYGWDEEPLEGAPYDDDAWKVQGK